VKRGIAAESFLHRCAQLGVVGRRFAADGSAAGSPLDRGALDGITAAAGAKAECRERTGRRGGDCQRAEHLRLRLEIAHQRLNLLRRPLDIDDRDVARPAPVLAALALAPFAFGLVVACATQSRFFVRLRRPIDKAIQRVGEEVRRRTVACGVHRDAILRQ